jgi:uncharacterized protein YjaZ
VARALDHINALLPGPPTSTYLYYGPGTGIIPQVGTGGYTSSATGAVTISFWPTPQASLHKAQPWLPRDLSHEVDHSVRYSTASVDCCSTLLELIITEGISSVLDETAFPGPPNPSDRAISAGQECAAWRKAQPLLGQVGLYGQWFFGSKGIPNLTGFVIGYHIVSDYHRHHPQTSWAALTAAPAATILAGSHYQPCPQ